MSRRAAGAVIGTIGCGTCSSQATSNVAPTRIPSRRTKGTASQRNSCLDDTPECLLGAPEGGEARRELRPLARVLVLEEHESLAPGQRLDALDPRAQVGVRVLGPAQAEIAPVAHRQQRRTGLAALVGVGRAQRGAALAQRR